MMPYQGYQLWQTERPKSAGDQRAADIRLGELAATLRRLCAVPVRAVRPVRARAMTRSRAGLTEVCNTEG